MADIFDDEKHSEIMRKVKSKKNKSTELRLIDIFKQNGITGWKRNYPVKGHPDFVFQKRKNCGVRRRLLLARSRLSEHASGGKSRILAKEARAQYETRQGSNGHV